MTKIKTPEPLQFPQYSAVENKRLAILVKRAERAAAALNSEAI